MKVLRSVWDPVRGASNAKENKISPGVLTPEEIKSDYYANKYKDVGGVRKAVAGIVGSTIATVPVIVETASDAIKEAERKLESDAYAAALQAEKIAWNKMNDYAASYFGSFDTIDEDELDRLKQEHDRAVDYRKSLEAQYEQPVDTDSWGMDLMEESAWLKDSATENLNGFWKSVADTAIDVGQGVALSPLMLLGPEAYLAGTAANAAAEEMLEKTEDGKSASDAFGSGLLTAGVEVAGGKIMDIKNPFKPASVKQVVKAIRNGNFEIINTLRKALHFEGVREGTNYLINYLADQMLRNPDAEFNINDFLESATKNKASKFVDKQSENLWNAIESAWSAIE